jgi:hypothetical protein
MREELDFTDRELTQLVMYGAEAAFLQGSEKKQLLSLMERQLAGWLNGTSN